MSGEQVTADRRRVVGQRRQAIAIAMTRHETAGRHIDGLTGLTDCWAAAHRQAHWHTGTALLHGLGTTVP